MAYRTKAILHIKLFEKARTSQEKAEQRQKILENLRLAEGVYPQDTSLYKLQITFSSDADKLKALQSSLQKIMSENMIVPRTDILFYVSEALEAKDKKLAQQFLDKAKEWYQVSRMIDTAQEMIDNGA